MSEIAQVCWPKRSSASRGGNHCIFRKELKLLLQFLVQ